MNKTTCTVAVKLSSILLDRRLRMFYSSDPDSKCWCWFICWLSWWTLDPELCWIGAAWYDYGLVWLLVQIIWRQFGPAVLWTKTRTRCGSFGLVDTGRPWVWRRVPWIFTSDQVNYGRNSFYFDFLFLLASYVLLLHFTPVAGRRPCFVPSLVMIWLKINGRSNVTWR